MTTVWLFTAAWGATVAEIVAGTHGWYIPILALFCFYAAVVFGWQRTLLPAATAAVLLDTTLARTSFASVLLLVVVFWLARNWVRFGECGTAWLQAVPGAAAGLLWGGGVILTESLLVERWGWHLLRHDSWLLLQAGLSGAVFLPLVVRAADAAANRMGFPLYADVQKKRGLTHA